MERTGRKWPSARAWRRIACGAAVLVLSACGVGTWETNPTPSPIRAIHAALLPNGKVLLVAGSGNQREAFNAGQFKTSIWDPVTNTFTAVSTPWDAFCAGHAQLADGRLLVAGGTAGYESSQTNNSFSGSRRAYVFNSETNTYQRVESMTTARWYPTLVTMGSGSVLTVAGQGADGRLTHSSQLFTGDSWTTNAPPPVRDDGAPGARQGWPLYPGLHLLADGRVFYSGAHTFGEAAPPGIWDLEEGTMTGVEGVPDLNNLDHAMSVLLPPAQDQKVMIIGGGNDNGALATDATAIVDFTEEDPEFVAAAKIDAPRMYVSAVILPDRTVFETGGASKMRNYGNNYVNSAQIYDPPTNTWTKAKDPGVGRGYHSSALLLPDGRVATFGSNPSDNSFEMRIELYSPEYLTRGPRPVITDGPTIMNYGRTYSLTATASQLIKNVSLVRPLAVTHSVDGNQRLVDVPFTTQEDGTLELSLTDNPDLAPPGWYMLFATDMAGVPSVAKWVHVQAAAPEPDPPTVVAPGLPIPNIPAPPAAQDG